jgi:uncharacterized protein (DUF427 family)
MESVWDYPRPPALEPTDRHIVIRHAGRIVADSRRPLRLLETSHPPAYYLPPDDVDDTLLVRAPGSSFCEWKGLAGYWDVVIGSERLRKVAWSYPDPVEAYAGLRDHFAFYAGPFDECTVDGEKVIPQPGGFYGGWITGDLVGPFKGVPGSGGW